MGSDPLKELETLSVEAELKSVEIQIPFPDSFTYANCVAFSLSLTEVRLSFAEALQNNTAVAKVGIVMPPETAAVLALVLLQQVKTYEAKFGEIRHPMWKATKK